MKLVDVKCKKCKNIIRSRQPCNSISELTNILFRPKAFRFSKHIREKELLGYLICKRCGIRYDRFNTPDFYIVARNTESYTPPIVITNATTEL